MGQVEYEGEVGYWKLEVERKAILSATDGKSADDTSIRFAPDMFRLMLLKHWNLYDSMFHTNYVATRLGIWKEKGRQRLTNLLVKMGIPHRESRQKYEQMDIKFKKLVNETLKELAASKYNMPELGIFSFGINSNNNYVNRT